ncbi:MAG TPA: 4-phosphoerythronate dehydrogenase, partial [Bacteroidales bacterium]|nr:4-phosphoerythronate dehydrogenase [Bacteroidales bacterium]
MDTRPHIVIDQQVPFLEGITGKHARITRMPGHLIRSGDIRKADALIVRTRTICSAALLQDSSVSFIGSPTIGTDHIDMEFCRSKGIAVANAPGCNSLAVMQYVFTALVAWAGSRKRDLCNMTLGIIGVGHVGKKVAALAGHLGMQTILNDPPRALAEGPEGFSDLGFLLDKSDIVTMHVPLDRTTRGMAHKDFFGAMKKGACFINTSRGDVVDEETLREASLRLGGIILDVWHGEPHIDPATVRITDIATPHIAGYSLEGKRNASQMVVRALAEHFGWDDLKDYSVSLPPPREVSQDLLFTRCFPIFVEDKQLRAAPEQFEHQRNAYVFRREWTPDQYRQLTLCLPNKIS